jgi:hypothetical protein
MGRNKKLKKAIKSFEKQIAKHEEKIKSYDGLKDTLIPYWEGEIERMENEKAGREKKLRRK